MTRQKTPDPSDVEDADEEPEFVDEDDLIFVDEDALGPLPADEEQADDNDDDGGDPSVPLPVPPPTRDDAVAVLTGGHSDAVLRVVFSPQEAAVCVSGGQDDRAVVWDVAARRPLAVCTGHTDSVDYVAFNRRGSLLMTADLAGGVRVWAWESLRAGAGAAPGSEPARPEPVWSVADRVEELTWIRWHPVADVLLAGCRSGAVWMWAVPAGDCKVFAADGAAASPTLAGICHPERYDVAFVAFADGRLKRLDLKAGQVTHTAAPSDPPTAPPAADDEGDSAASSGAADSAGDRGTQIAIAGDLVVTGSAADAVVRFYSQARSVFVNNVTVSRLPGDSVETMAFGPATAEGASSSGPLLACGTLHGVLAFVATARLLSVHSVPPAGEGPRAGLTRLVWHPSRPLLLAARLDACVVAYDTRRGVAVAEWRGPAAAPLDLCLAVCGSVFAAAADAPDNSVRVYSVDGGLRLPDT